MCFLFSFIYYFINMENVIISKSEKVISDCHLFDRKDWSWEYISVDYLWKVKNWENWETKPFFKIFPKSSLPAWYEKKSKEEICQELKWKKLVSETKIVL